MAIRKNLTTLSPTEKKTFVNAVLALKDGNKAGNLYNQYVKVHSDASLIHTPSGSSRTVPHAGPAFLAWHREFIRRFELDLQAIAPGIGLPYWDWAADAALSNPKNAPIWQADFMGGNGDTSANGYNVVKTGPFRYGQWTVIDENGNPMRFADGMYVGGLRRRLGIDVPTLPTQSQVDAAINKVPYDKPPWDQTTTQGHRNQLEGYVNAPQLHNRVHRWVGKSMRLLTSPNDPTFFLHHCNIDRLWAKWQAKNSSYGYVPQGGGPIGHNVNDLMYPWPATPASVLDHKALGYSYDTE